ncbi:putative leader peptide [Streptomyces aculeolatus]
MRTSLRTIDGMLCSKSGPRPRGQADHLTKRRAVDLCRVAAMLCRTA